MLTRLFFYNNTLSKEDLEPFISDYIRLQQATLDEFIKISIDADSEMDACQRYTLKFAIEHRQFLIGWYQKLQEDLSSNVDQA